MTKNETANKVLDYLKPRSYTWTDTIRMMLTLEIKDNTGNRTAFRAILDRLAGAGKLYKIGRGKFRWKIKVESWDRSDPFKPEPGSGVTVGEMVRKMAEDAELDEEGEEGDDPTTTDNSDLIDKLRELRREMEAADEKAEDEITKLKEELASVKASSSQAVKVLKIEKYDGTVIKLKDVVLPAYFQKVVDLAKCRRNILLVGPAGCGKSTLAEMLAKALGLDFGKVGGSGGLQEIHLLGKSTPNLTKGTAHYSTTDFVTCYEEGGVCLVDELDGADPNVLLALNPALDRSGRLPLPGRPDRPAKRHKDFVCVATANTIGRGANRTYYGRNQLDEATLDRFRIGTVECDYDPVVEKALCPDDDLRAHLQGIRKKIEETGLRRIMSTRFLEDAYIMQQTAKWDKEEITRTFLAGWTADEKAKIGGAY